MIRYDPFPVSCQKDSPWKVATDERAQFFRKSSVLNKLSLDRFIRQSFIIESIDCAHITQICMTLIACVSSIEISHHSSTLNCDFSHTFQPTPFKLLLTSTRGSFCATDIN